MQPPFDGNLKEIAGSMGVALYQRFTLNEASLFLRCPVSGLQNLLDKKEIQLFGDQLLQHLLSNVIGNPPQAQQSNIES